MFEQSVWVHFRLNKALECVSGTAVVMNCLYWDVIERNVRAKMRMMMMMMTTMVMMMTMIIRAFPAFGTHVRPRAMIIIVIVIISIRVHLVSDVLHGGRAGATGV